MKTFHYKYSLNLFEPKTSQITVAISLQDKGEKHIHPVTRALENLNSEIDVISGESFSFVQKLLSDGHGKSHSEYTLELETLYKVNRQE